MSVRVLEPPPLAERAARLHHSPLFASLPPSDVKALAEGCETLGVAANTPIIHQGDVADAFYVVVDGLLRARRRDASGNDDVVGHLYKGEFFGELALVESTTRSATVEAQSDAVLMRLSRAAFERALVAHPTVQAHVADQVAHRRRLYLDRPRPDDATLRSHLSALLGGVDLSIVGELPLEWVWVEEGTVLIAEGDTGDCMFFLLNGRLQVYKHRQDGSEYVLDEVRPGEAVGEAALVEKARRNASVRALEDSEVLRLHQDGLDALMLRHPYLERQLRELAASHDANRTGRVAIARFEKSAAPRPSELLDVMNEPDLPRRNLRITWMYHRLSLGLQKLLGRDDANWACFGCRASYTAGYSIRKEDDLLPQAVRRLEGAWGVGRLIGGVQRLARATPLGRETAQALATTSQCISAGNLRIFAEIGTVMCRFLIAFGDDTARDDAKLAGFLRTMPPGPPEMGGQDVLRLGMKAWYEARFAPTAKSRSEWILLGNAYIGVHEQTRVQADLIEALEAPLRMHLGDEVGAFFFDNPPLRWLPARLRSWARARVDAAEQRWVRMLGMTLRNVITRRMMRIRMSNRDVWLGEGGLAYPDALVGLENAELRAVLSQYGADGDSPPGRGASDWGTFADRMRFILLLFRAGQRDPGLFDPPFDRAP